MKTPTSNGFMLLYTITFSRMCSSMRSQRIYLSLVTASQAHQLFYDSKLKPTLCYTITSCNIRVIQLSTFELEIDSEKEK